MAGFPPWQPGFNPRSGYVEFVMGKVAPRWVSPKYFSFPSQFSFCQLLQIHLSSYHLPYRIMVGSQKERDHYEDQDAGGQIILK
jgi:hypothetical protein